MISKIINRRAACLRELASNPKSFSNCPDLHGGVPDLALIRQINLFQILNHKVTMTIEKWVKEEKMRLGRFKICCVNAQKEEAKSFPLEMTRSCWSGQYRTWDDSLDALSIR